MTSDRFTKHFADVSQFNYGSHFLPDLLDRCVTGGGDGYSGLQGMIQEAMSAYGPRHVIYGIDVESGAANGFSVTGTAGYYMWDGRILQFTAASGTITSGQYAFISGDGSLNITTTDRDDVTGVILAMSGAGTTNIINMRQVWDKNKIHNTYIKQAYFEGFTGISGQIEQLNNKIYYVSDLDEFTAALTGIDVSSGAGKIILMDSFGDVGVKIDAPNSSFVIEGQGDATKLTAKNTFVNMFVVEACKSITFRDFMVDMSGNDNTTEGFQLSLGTDNPTILENITITGINDENNGIYINQKYVKILKCRFFDLLKCVEINDGRSRINSCEFQGSRIAIDINSPSNRNIITNNELTDNSCNTSTSVKLVNVDSDMNVINNNVIRTNTNVGAGDMTGVWIQAGASNNIFIGNVVDNNDLNYSDEGTNTLTGSITSNYIS